MDKFQLFNPPPLMDKIHIHIYESPEALTNTTIHGPVPVALIDPSQGSFAQLGASPDNNLVVNIVQYETRTAHLPDCVTSFFTCEQKFEHQKNANAISHFDGTNDHALRVGEIATQQQQQQQQQQLDAKYHLPSRKIQEDMDTEMSAQWYHPQEIKECHLKYITRIDYGRKLILKHIFTVNYPVQ